MKNNRDFIIVSAADANFTHLLDDLLKSIRKAVGDNLPALGVLDLGLERQYRNKLEEDGVIVVEPEWDYKVPDDTPPYMRAMTARPHLPKYFPGYELVMWMDADTWVQEWETIELYRQAAIDEVFAITPESDRTYSSYIKRGHSYIDRHYSLMEKVLSKSDAKELCITPIINVGVFCAQENAPHWDAWDKVLEIYLSVEMTFFAEQIALNIMLHTSNLHYAALPSRCNWICSRALPKISTDRTKLLEAGYPHAPIGIVHLTGHLKDHMATILTPSDEKCETRLCYSDIKKLASQPYNLFST